MSVDVSIVVPVYGEAASLGALADEIQRACMDASLTFEAHFIDDGSQDDSWDVICALHANDPRFVGVRFRKNYGKSAALMAGFARARGRVVVTMDADLQDDPAELPALVSMIDGGLDLVSGWKQRRQDPLGKRLPSAIFNGVTRTVSRIKLHDFNCGLKAYRSEVVRTLRVYGEMHRYIPLLAKWEGYDRIGEKKVNHRVRRHGRSKFGAERYVRGCLDLLTVTYLTRFGARPMHFFGSWGLLAFLGGFGLSLWISIEKWFFGRPIGDRPALLLGALMIMVGLLLMSTGFVAELIVRQRMEHTAPYDIVAEARAHPSAERL